MAQATEHRLVHLTIIHRHLAQVTASHSARLGTHHRSRSPPKNAIISQQSFCTFRCTCEKCTIEECQCCQEKDVMVAKMEEFNEYEGDSENITCVIDHPGFQSNCLDVWVLQTAYHHYSKRDRQQAGDQPRNE